MIIKYFGSDVVDKKEVFSARIPIKSAGNRQYSYSSMLARGKILPASDSLMRASFRSRRKLDEQQIDRVLGVDDGESIGWWIEEPNTSLRRKRNKKKEDPGRDEGRKRIESRDERRQRGRGKRRTQRQEGPRTPTICHGRPYVGILDVSYLPLIAASVIQAEDKRARNKIRTGSTGLPYSPLRRAPRKHDAVLRCISRERKRP